MPPPRRRRPSETRALFPVGEPVVGPHGPIRIVVADDHAVVRSGLRMLLESETDIEVVAEAADSAAALRYVQALRPNVLILDLSMPGGREQPAIADFLERSPATRVVALAMQRDPAFVRRALRAGAAGYVVKDCADDELVPAVRTVAAGGVHMPAPNRRDR